MNLKSSYIFTGQNDHWYHDHNYNKNVLEIRQENIKSMTFKFDELEIVLKKESEMYKAIERAGGKDFTIQIPWSKIENFATDVIVPCPPNIKGIPYSYIIIVIDCAFGAVLAWDRDTFLDQQPR